MEFVADQYRPEDRKARVCEAGEKVADFYTRRESPEQKQAYLERQLQKLHPGCTITITISPPEAALAPGA